MRKNIWVSLGSSVFFCITNALLSRCLLPGVGHVELVQIDWTPIGLEYPGESAIQAWSDAYHRGASNLGRTAQVCPINTRCLLKRAGFVQISETVLPCHLVPQKKASDFEEDDQKGNEFQRLYEAPSWLNVIFGRLLPTLSREPMLDGLGMSEADIGRICQAATEESRRESCRVQFRV